MKVLLLSVKAGYGHHSTAKAIMEYFEKNGHECKMLDIFNYISNRLGKYVNDGYLLTTRYLPKAYGRAYGKMAEHDEPYDRYSLTAYLSTFVSKKLAKYVSDYEPDLMIGTHSYAGVCMSILCDSGAAHCPTIGIVTDYTVHPFWESSFLDYYVVPDALLNEEMELKGIGREKILPFGIPVREQFTRKINKSEARDKLEIDDMPTVLVMMGSMGFGDISEQIGRLDNSEHDFQMLCVCGNNHKMKKEIDAMSHIHNIHTYGFVENVDEMMDACDFIITKPGGLTTSEALAKGLPMIIMNPIPGHERRNFNFLVNTGVAIGVNETYSLSEAVNLMFSSPWRVSNMRECVGHIGKPNATADLYDFSMSIVEKRSAQILNSLPER